MVDEGDDPRLPLARLLRRLRYEHWPNLKITQAQLAQALGNAKPISVPLISSWESMSNPRIPPVHRLEAYAAFFATRRSVDAGGYRLLEDEELTPQERGVRDGLSRELLHLRSAAMRGADPTAGDPGTDSVGESYYRFDDDRPITIVAAQLPDDMLADLPHSNPADPHYVALSAYADLDALFELHGHIRAVNPASEVHVRTSEQLNYSQQATVVGRLADDYTTHLVMLGGVERNLATRSVFNRINLPILQIADWKVPDGQYFEIEKDGMKQQYRPTLDRSADREILLEDVALFVRAINPFNRKRTVTICNGMYGSGTFGAVRALTDGRFRDRNTDYARTKFGQNETFCIIMRVTVENGVPLTPDWTLAENRLFEWSSEA